MAESERGTTRWRWRLPFNLSWVELVISLSMIEISSLIRVV